MTRIIHKFRDGNTRHACDAYLRGKNKDDYRPVMVYQPNANHDGTYDLSVIDAEVTMADVLAAFEAGWKALRREMIMESLEEYPA